MRRKGLSPVEVVVILVVVTATVAAAAAWLMGRIPGPLPPFPVEARPWEPVDAFNGTDTGYRGCMFKYNTTVFVDCAGNGWLLYENATHAFVQQIATFDGWTALKKSR